MAEQKDSIFLEVKIDTDKVAKNLANATKQVTILKQEQKLLTKAFDEGAISDIAYAKAIAESKAELEKANREVKSSTALLQAETLARLDDNASLDEQRMALNAAQKAYAQLSGEEKAAADSAGGLREQIAKLSDRVKEQEAAIGDARRNVGNYAMQTAEAAGKMGFFGKGLSSLVNPIKNVTTGLKAASATPFLAIVSVLITILQKLSERFKGNAAAMEKLTGVFGVFSGIGNIVNGIIDKIADGLGWLAEKALSMADQLGLLSDKMKEGIAIAREDLDIQQAQRDAAMQTAEDQKRIAELRADANDKERLSASERLKRLKEAVKMEENVAQRQYELAKREYDLQVKKNAQSASSQDDLKKENELKIAMLNAETALFNKRKELNGQIESARQENIKNEQAAADARLAIQRKLEDSLLALERDETQKAIIQAQRAGDREVEDMRIKLERLKTTDKQGREALQQMIVAKEQETQQKINDIIVRAQAEREEKMRANTRAMMEIGVHDQLELANLRYEAAKEDYDRLINLTDEQIAVLYGTQEDYTAAVIASDRQMYDTREALATERYEREKLRHDNEYQEELAAAGENELAIAQVELENETYLNEQLLTMDEETKMRLYGSQEAFESAVIASNNRMKTAQKKVTEEMRKDAINKVQAISGAIGALGNLLDQYSEENKEAAIASKAIALGQIAVQTGIAIAEGTAQAQSVPFPANIAAIATTIATIIGNIATAISTVKGAKFATGGIVGGNSYTGDHVPVFANSREMYLTVEQQQNLFDFLNGGGSENGTFGMNYGLLAEAVAAQPAPVVVYEEFQDFGKKVATYNELAAI